MSDRKRHGFVLLLVLGLVAASLAVIATQQTRLGLDLKGGVELVYKGTPTKSQPTVTLAALQRAVDVMENRVNQLGVTQPTINTQSGGLIDVQLPDVTNQVQAEQDVGETARLAFRDWEANVLTPSGQTAAKGLEAQDPAAVKLSQAGGGEPGVASTTAGGMELYPAVELAAKQPKSTTGNSANFGNAYYLFAKPGSAACAAWGKRTSNVPVKGQYCLVSGPDVAQPSTSYANAVATLKAGLKPAEKVGTLVKVVKQGTIVLQASPNSFNHVPAFGSQHTLYYALRDRVALFGDELKNPEESTDSSGQPDVSFGFNSQGNKAFQSVTAKIAQRGEQLSLGGETLEQHFAVALDDQLLTVPSIDFTQNPDGIGGGAAEISGNFTATTATNLANQLRLGALPIGLKRISVSTVSATLGSQALHQGLIAGLVGLLVVAVFLLFYYRLLGLIAITCLVAYGLYFYALIKLIPITMTLAGIAGLILTIGVAADANIVIFERVKEEIRAGRSVRQGIAIGYRKGLTAIIDANVVTIMTAFILFVLATQDVKGFAFMLGVGTIVSLFTAVLATQAILMTLSDTKAIQSPSALGAGGKSRVWRYDFMGKSKFFFTMSGVILLVGALAIGGRGLNLGIDFTSGTQIAVGLKTPATVPQIRTLMTEAGDGNATIQAVHGDKALGKNGFQISSKPLTARNQDNLRAQLNNKFGIRGGLNGLNITTVGPTFGASVTHSAIVAIIISLLVISIYVALRFEWKFTIPVLIALMHDLLITAGVYALTGRVVTTDTVAALLTILGYSLYDTIIVFDRVRENIPRMPRAPFSQIVNRSMSEVLTRSLATTSCTLLPIIALLIFGGSTLKDFAFALLIGVASGAYSSIFIASPVLMHWKEREQGYRNRRARVKADLGYVPAYADGGDVEPTEAKVRRTGRLTQPSDENVSAAEFEQMKRDLGIEQQSTPRRSKVRGAAATAAPPASAPTAAPAAAEVQAPQPPVDPNAPVAPAPDLAENDGVAQVNDGATAPNQRPRPRNRKHGRR